MDDDDDDCFSAGPGPSSDPGTSASTRDDVQSYGEKTFYEVYDSDGKTILIEAPAGSVHIDEHGNTVIYDVSLEEEIYATEAPDVGIEEVVEEICTVDESQGDDGGWVQLDQKQNVDKRRYEQERFSSARTVLLSSKSLVGKPVLHGKAGPRPGTKSKKLNANELPKTNMEASALNQDLPTMKNMFQVMAESALLKSSLSDSEGSFIAEDCEPTMEADSRDAKDLELQPTGNVQVDDVDATIQKWPLQDFCRFRFDTQTGNMRNESVDVEMDPTVTSVPMPANATEIQRRNFREFFHQWPLYWNSAIDFQEACEVLVGLLHVPPQKVCNGVPKGFKGVGTFVIDLRNLVDRSELAFDGLGSWGKPSGKVRYYAENAGHKMVRADNGKGQLYHWAKQYSYKCILNRYEHPSTINNKRGKSRFEKKVYTARFYPDKSAVSIAIVSYNWVGGQPVDFPVQDNRRFSVVPPPEYAKTWEEASYENNEMTALPHSMSAYFEGCPLYAHGAIDFNDAASIVLGGTSVDPDKICSAVPQGFRSIGSFVVDLKKLMVSAQLRKDNNGLWGKPAGHSRYYKLDEATGDAVRVDKGNKLIAGVDYDVQVLSKRYEHPQVAKRFVRKIYTGRGKTSDEDFAGSPYLAVITYFWKGEPEVFEPLHKQNEVYFKGRKGQIEIEDDEDHNGYGDLAQAPRAKKIKMENEAMEEMSFDPAFSAGELNTMRLNVYKKELENQERISAILDKAETVVDRLMDEVFNKFPPSSSSASNSASASAQVDREPQIVEEEPFPHQLEPQTPRSLRSRKK